MTEILNWRPMRAHPKMRAGLEFLTRLLPPGIVGVEIGSYAGESAGILASSGKFKKLICVDMWDPGYYSGKQLISAEKHFDEVAAKFPCIEKAKMDCNDVLQLLEKNPVIDFCYVDGNHTEPQVSTDLFNCLSLMRNSKVRILAGHDYDYIKSPAVKPAIIKALGYADVLFCDYSWLKFLS